MLIVCWDSYVLARCFNTNTAMSTAVKTIVIISAQNPQLSGPNCLMIKRRIVFENKDKNLKRWWDWGASFHGNSGCLLFKCWSTPRGSRDIENMIWFTPREVAYCQWRGRYVPYSSGGSLFSVIWLGRVKDRSWFWTSYFLKFLVWIVIKELSDATTSTTPHTTTTVLAKEYYPPR